MSTTYKQDVAQFAAAAVTMEATGTQGVRKLAAAAARAFLREHAARTSNGETFDSPQRAKFWKEFRGDAEVQIAEYAEKKGIDVTEQHSSHQISLVRKVCERDTENKYLTPWAADDFTVGVRSAYEALNPKKEKRAPTAESIAKYVIDNCAKYDVPLADVLALLA